ncbi:magnesium transporter CorA [Methanocella sp. CWC-04]|uniref:Magnesium transporter CorA n=1 Tax=Methanooceanicella nereidis TaxID=2052831 RepID=A0AAP2W676_9EURY|nr:CorA family divalent cation transporter [Methanocella sp. CWC-04]MCD1294987.1 magnesium transporter CorA [Methanocella sp. CWC-04]
MDDQVLQTVQLDSLKTSSSFCVHLKADGSVEKLTNLSLTDYLAPIKNSSVAWIDCTTKDLEKELEKISHTMGFTQIPIQKLLSGFFSSYEDADTELGIMLPAVALNGLEITVRPLIILVRDNFVVTVHNEDIVRLLKFSRYAGPFLKKLRSEPRLEQMTLILERIIDENNDRNFEYLREIEKRGDDISKKLIDENISKKQLAHEIYEMKHVLIDYLNVLWATKDVVDSLRYGDADLITDDEKLLGRIGILSDNIDRHIELSEQMSNVLASGLEVMQSIYNNQLQTMNNKFAIVTAYLTVLGTAFLVPNTIATIVSSSPRLSSMVEGSGDVYFYLLGLSTLLATVISYLWVRKVWSKKDDN